MIFYTQIRYYFRDDTNMLALHPFSIAQLEQMMRSEQRKLETYLKTIDKSDLTFDIIFCLHTKKKNIQRLSEEIITRKNQLKEQIR